MNIKNKWNNGFVRFKSTNLPSNITSLIYLIVDDKVEYHPRTTSYRTYELSKCA